MLYRRQKHITQKTKTTPYTANKNTLHRKQKHIVHETTHYTQNRKKTQTVVYVKQCITHYTGNKNTKLLTRKQGGQSMPIMTYRPHGTSRDTQIHQVWQQIVQ